jgi:hypothetical protein
MAEPRADEFRLLHEWFDKFEQSNPVAELLTEPGPAVWGAFFAWLSKHANRRVFVKVMEQGRKHRRRQARRHG